MIIRIADLPIEWQDSQAEFVSEFSFDTCIEPLMSVAFRSKLAECHGVQYTDSRFNKVLRADNGEILFADDEWRFAEAYFTQETGDYALPLAAMCSRLSYFDTVLLHASLVDYNGSGIIFTGKSGAGKTTQAELWQKYMGADIINGDKAFVRCREDCVFACGLPWKGSSSYCVNSNVPLRAIVVLRQAKENMLTRLDATEAAQMFMPHVFLPHWDERCTACALDTVEKIIAKVPVYVLECRADEAAVTLLHGTVFNN